MFSSGSANIASVAELTGEERWRQIIGQLALFIKLIAFLKKLQILKQEWQKSPTLGPGKQTAKT